MGEGFRVEGPGVYSGVFLRSGNGNPSISKYPYPAPHRGEESPNSKRGNFL